LRSDILRQQVEILERVVRGRERKRLLSFIPYPKQYEFFATGLKYRQRALMAANRVGKTMTAAHEVAMHLTGMYPDWWPGRRYDRPVAGWVVTPSSEKLKDPIQIALFGTPDPNMKHENFGTGAIPKDTILDISTRQSNVKGVAELIQVRHSTGGISTLGTKTFEQGREKVQGASLDFVWPDEEVPSDIYGELVARVQDRDGMVMCTFTPLMGMTGIVQTFLENDDKNPRRTYVNMTLHDCIGGIWPDDGSDFAGKPWKGHYTAERVDQIINDYPVHERKTRVLGIPLMGEGLVFPVDVEDITINPIEVPRHWARICGLDFGIDHPTAAAWLAYDRDADTIYLTDVYRKADALISTHAAAILQRDPNKAIPVAWPHDGLKRDHKSGERIADAYRKLGVNMMRDSARYKDETGGAQPVEPVVMDILERMQTGRFKVFSTCRAFLDEMRTYHRKNNQIVDTKDDAISAVRMAVMMLRYARTGAMNRSAVVLPYRKPIVGGH
jgi:phage terminase large subunit-like protein